MAVRAQAKYVRVAPRKAREVVDLIRGKSVAEARSTLFFANRNAARVDEGPTLKRWKFRAMSRVSRIQKRSSHVTIAVEQREVRS